MIVDKVVCAAPVCRCMCKLVCLPSENNSFSTQASILAVYSRGEILLCTFEVRKHHECRQMQSIQLKLKYQTKIIHSTCKASRLRSAMFTFLFYLSSIPTMISCFVYILSLVQVRLDTIKVNI